MNDTEPSHKDRVRTEVRPEHDSDESRPEAASGERPREIGGRKGLDPVRYGDWEKNGRCIDF
ncbi:MAG: DUF1674 domain-containing protein [Wenzhouxiangellaceae bacterium]|nr:DUF1674 domain-containing protein [Wenzhouxiangellaceae bacterium]